MPTFSAAQTVRPTAQDARLSAPARFTAAQVPPQPAHTFGLVLDPVWELSAAQVVQNAPRHRLTLRLSPLPAEPRPEGTPAAPRLGAGPADPRP